MKEPDEVAGELARLTAEVKGARGDLGRVEGKIDHVEERVVRLERWRYAIAGGLVVLAWVARNEVSWEDLAAVVGVGAIPPCP